MLKKLDEMPLWILVVMALALGLAPFQPQPHLVEKLGMLAAGTLSKPIDMFDLVLHASLPILLAIRLVRMALGLDKASEASED